MTANMYFALLFSFGFILAGVYAQPSKKTDADKKAVDEECIEEESTISKQATSKNYFYMW